MPIELKDLEAALDSKLKEIREQAASTLAELKAAVQQEIAEKTKNGFADPETKEKLARIEIKYSQLEAQMLRPDAGKAQKAFETASDRLAKIPEFESWQKSGFRTSKGNRFAIDGPLFEQKLISDTALGAGTSGVLMPTRLPGLVTLPHQELRIRDLLRVEPMVGTTKDWLKQNVVTNAASPQTEGVAKAESGITYTTDSAVARTIAHFIQVTRQALDDMPELRQDIDSELMYGLKVKEENEILSGDGTGVHLNGIITQGTAYDTTLNVASDTRLDKLRHAIYQVRASLYAADGIVLNPKDVHTIELIKEDTLAANTGKYLVGDPKAGGGALTLWGKPVVESDSIAIGTFLVGSFQLGARLFDRMQAVLEISFEHSTNFTTNQATILCEERIALAVLRSLAFVKGTF